LTISPDGLTLWQLIRRGRTPASRFTVKNGLLLGAFAP
jgi:hypothetical protein